MVICLERGADSHRAQLMPLPLTVSCFSKIEIGFTFLVPAYPGCPGKWAVKRVCVCLSSVYCSRELIDSLMARSWPAISHNFLQFIVFHPATEVCISLEV